MHSLRTSRHLLQLLPQPALPKVSGGGSRPLARSASPGASPDPLRPCGLHPSPEVGATGLAEQEGHLRSPVPHQCRDPSRNRSRSETPRRRDRLLQRSPYLESETGVPPACPLRGSRRWAVSQPHALGPVPPRVLSSRQSARACLSRQVRRGTPARFSGWQAQFSRRLAAPHSAENLCCVAETTISKGLGGLRETTVRRPGACAPLSRPLHPSCSHLQSSTGLVC